MAFQQKMAFAVIKMLRCLLSNSLLQHFLSSWAPIFKETQTKFSSTDLILSLSNPNCSSWYNILLETKPQLHF